MKKAIPNFKMMALAVVILSFLMGCSNKLERYEDPEWLGGTNLQTLESEKENGNYSIYLQLMEKAEYRKTVEKQLTTLFVPHNDAFKKYFQKMGITSVEDLTKEQAKVLFTLHFLADPKNASHLVYEKAWSRLESPTGEYKSLFFRKPTKCDPEPYLEVPKYDKVFAGRSLYIYTQSNKYIGIYSNLYFQDYGGKAAIDYEFLFPESKWNGFLHWHNAPILFKPSEKKTTATSIEDFSYPTASGFIYYLDQVVDPFITIDQYLANKSNYSLFYDLMQRFATYAVASKTDPKGGKSYGKTYTSGGTISNIAIDRFRGEPEGQLYMYTVFAPNNEVLQAYLDNTVLKSYTSLDEVPKVTLQYILQGQITDRLELKSKFTNLFFNSYGDKSVIDAANVSSDFMCSNGMVYNSKKILEPNVFLCVPGQLFFNKDYSAFLTILTQAGLIPTISSFDKEITLFAPTNDQLLAANIKVAITALGAEEVQLFIENDAQWKKMSTDDLNLFAQDHIYVGNAGDLSGDGYMKMLSENYVHYSSNTISAGLNSKLQVIPSIGPDATNSRNGKLVKISEPILSKYKIGEAIKNDPDMAEFTKLLFQAKMLDSMIKEVDYNIMTTNIQITTATGAYEWTIFAPSNASILQAIADGIIPTDVSIAANMTALKDFLNYHIVKKAIFDNGKFNGEISTILNGKSIVVSNSPGNLKITDATGQEVAVNHANANILVRRGVIHKIPSVLKNK